MILTYKEIRDDIMVVNQDFMFAEDKILLLMLDVSHRFWTNRLQMYTGLNALIPNGDSVKR
jgi:hypothetical protein